MEPWLDSLSEDWKSEQRSSSPAPSLPLRRQRGSLSLSQSSQSRIPHLANSMRKDSSNSINSTRRDSTTGTYLRLRSTKGKAKSRGEPALQERTPSSLNALGPSGSHRQPSLPRRTSSVFSESQNSVQHHSVREPFSDAETPEWKKRLVKGEDLTSDGFDLFSPSKLEGVFKEPIATQLRSENDSQHLESEPQQTKPFSLPQSNAFPQQFSSFRPMRNHRPDLEVLQEVTEDEESNPRDISAMSSEHGLSSLPGLVSHRVRSFERTRSANSGTTSPKHSSVLSDKAESVIDSRIRTVSGRREMENEFISPITISKQNSIRASVMRSSLSMDVKELQSKLEAAAAATQDDRPTSSSSDKEISYGHVSVLADDDKMDHTWPSSFPSDLSVGTEGFSTQKANLNGILQRLARSATPSTRESSMIHRDQTNRSSRVVSAHGASMSINSSPPQHSHLMDDTFEQSGVSASVLESPPDTSVIHHIDAHVRPSSSGSPLKLFGNRDTYTNNKLNRILSQFEETTESSFDDLGDKLAAKTESILLMSQFGLGDLDDFGFENQIPPPLPIQAATFASTDRIFRSKVDVSTLLQKSPRLATTFARDVQAQHTAPQSPATLRNDRSTTKRRKTLLDSHVSVQNQDIEVKITQIDDVATLAGTKRKDARPGNDSVLANSDILLSRLRLRPASATQRSLKTVPSVPATIEQPVVDDKQLKEAVATELANFAHEVMDVAKDSRKPSMGTKDYLEEANKVMEFIRSKGKPLVHLTTIRSETTKDEHIDEDSDPDSTKDSFTRPPSREHVRKPRADPRHARHNSRVASHLRKFRDEEDTDNLTNFSAAFGPTSAKGDISPADSISRLNSISVVYEEQESNPPNMHILNPEETLRKRKHSASTIEGSIVNQRPQSQDSSHHSTQNTFPTNSTASGPKGVIPSGTISIPDQVAGLTFDKEKKLWVKKLQASAEQPRSPVTEDDPFDSIPDLSVNETRENAVKVDPKTVPAAIAREKQPRAVTIAFSSPVVSAVNYVNISEDDIESLPREEDLPVDDSEMEFSELSVIKHSLKADQPPVISVEEIHINGADDPPKPAFQTRTISPIEEQDEEPEATNMSLVPITRSTDLIATPQRAVIKHHRSAYRAPSILCLTPLSDFTLHQVDVGKNPDLSYVSERKHPQALRQAHGSLSLANDQLVKAITNAAGGELFWDKLRQLDILPGKVSSVHSLKKYCPVLEDVSMSDNIIEHVTGMPKTVRTLDLHNNMLTNLTSWNHLVNLQYLDVSGNQLDSLDGFSSLVHLRSLKANNNHITNITGILNLKGLIDLEVHHNDISVVDFSGSQLRRLKTLDLSNNKIKEVKNLHNLSRLEELDVSNNAIEKWLSEKTDRSISLRKLQASHNMLASIHLKNMPTLKFLDLDNNSINQVSDLSNSYNLESLSLRDQDNAPDIVNLILSTPNECRHIRLSSNEVADGSITLPTLPQHNVRELELAACGISDLPERFGSYFPNCRKLNLNFNAIKDVIPLRGMQKITHLFIAQNRISRLRRTCILFSKLTHLREIDIRENPLTLGFYVRRLDEITAMKRRTMELLLSENCKNLVDFNGMELCRSDEMKSDALFKKLTTRGVIGEPAASDGAVFN
ncbi:hypothetical protein LTR84_009668 [Exophiala bonariae]|uniref:Septation initiation network scaffold protein cdc11 n=1 Tax=Exophiala bonariae TaxID=1690606 RepID=A0AAV9NLH2_9EURO|nr:hypothetical protein LTR84_009668 [Exophiala bonariae]